MSMDNTMRPNNNIPNAGATPSLTGHSSAEQVGASNEQVNAYKSSDQVARGNDSNYTNAELARLRRDYKQHQKWNAEHAPHLLSPGNPGITPAEAIAARIAAYREQAKQNVAATCNNILPAGITSSDLQAAIAATPELFAVNCNH